MKTDISPLMKSVLTTAENKRPSVITRFLRQREHGKRSVPEIRSWKHSEVVEAVKKATAESNKKTLSRHRLQELHNERPKEFPSPVTIDLMFEDGWKMILKEAGIGFSKSENPSLRILSRPPRDVLYFLDLYRRFGLQTKQLYLEARRKYPEVVPPYVALLRTIGGMEALTHLARLESNEDQIMTLVKLMNDLGGRWPRKRLCRQHAIDRGFLERKFGGKIELEEICRELLVFYRQQRSHTEEKT
jgi:hypothetical protein